MPALVKRLTAAGLSDIACSADSLSDAATLEPTDGVYTVSNTYNATQTLLLDAHLDRLEDSASRAGFPLSLDRARLRQALRKTIIDSGYGDVRFRITAPANAPDALTFSLEPCAPPSPDQICNGVRCVTTSAAARLNPEAKSSSWIQIRESLMSRQPADIYEVFLVDSRGRILEGLSSNFYAVIDGELLTASAGVLAGIARQVVFEICADIVALQPRAPRLDQLPRFDEAFLTSSSRGIIPVVAIDDIIIGTGRAGVATKALRQSYDRWVADNLEEL